MTVTVDEAEVIKIKSTALSDPFDGVAIGSTAAVTLPSVTLRCTARADARAGLHQCDNSPAVYGKPVTHKLRMLPELQHHVLTIQPATSQPKP